MTFRPAEGRKEYPSSCDLCSGTITERRVNLPYPDKDGAVRLVKGATAGVCDQCHAKYLTAETANAIDELASGSALGRGENPGVGVRQGWLVRDRSAVATWRHPSMQGAVS